MSLDALNISVQAGWPSSIGYTPVKSIQLFIYRISLEDFAMSQEKARSLGIYMATLVKGLFSDKHKSVFVFHFAIQVIVGTSLMLIRIASLLGESLLQFMDNAPINNSNPHSTYSDDTPPSQKYAEEYLPENEYWQ